MTNKIWVLDHDDFGVETYSGDRDPLTIPTVVEELGFMEDGFEDEVATFKADLARAVKRGYGDARIEERFTLELQDVK